MTSADASPNHPPDTPGTTVPGGGQDTNVNMGESPAPNPPGAGRGHRRHPRPSLSTTGFAEVLLVYDAVHHLLDGETSLGQTVSVALVAASTSLPADAVRRALDTLTAREILHVAYHRGPTAASARRPAHPTTAEALAW